MCGDREGHWRSPSHAPGMKLGWEWAPSPGPQLVSLVGGRPSRTQAAGAAPSVYISEGALLYRQRASSQIHFKTQRSEFGGDYLLLT